MNEKKVYSNAKKTTDTIKENLIALLATTDISDISITNLVKMSGINRATFYLHYRSINGVIIGIEKDVQDKYSSIRQTTQDVDIYENTNYLIDIISNYINTDKNFFRAIINTNMFNRMTVMLGNLLSDIMIKNMIKFHHIEDTNIIFYPNISMFTGGLVIVFRDWITSSNDDISTIIPFLKKTALEFVTIKL